MFLFYVYVVNSFVLNLYFRGKSRSNKYSNSAFRVWFSRLHELRSLSPGDRPVHCTHSTETADTRKDIFDVLDMKNPLIILESPNKPNISYVVQYMPKTANLSDYFIWIVNEVLLFKNIGGETRIHN
jgi:superfamily II DNA helicase RecQ